MYPCDLTGHEFVTSKINPDEEICVHCLLTRLNTEKTNIYNVPPKSATDQLREARHNAWRVRDFKEIHVSADFLLRSRPCGLRKPLGALIKILTIEGYLN